MAKGRALVRLVGWGLAATALVLAVRATPPAAAPEPQLPAPPRHRAPARRRRRRGRRFAAGVALGALASSAFLAVQSGSDAASADVVVEDTVIVEDIPVCTPSTEGPCILLPPGDVATGPPPAPATIFGTITDDAERGVECDIHVAETAEDVATSEPVGVSDHLSGDYSVEVPAGTWFLGVFGCEVADGELTFDVPGEYWPGVSDPGAAEPVTLEPGGELPADFFLAVDDGGDGEECDGEPCGCDGELCECDGEFCGCDGEFCECDGEFCGCDGEFCECDGEPCCDDESCEVPPEVVPPDIVLPPDFVPPTEVPPEELPPVDPGPVVAPPVVLPPAPPIELPPITELPPVIELPPLVDPEPEEPAPDDPEPEEPVVDVPTDRPEPPAPPPRRERLEPTPPPDVDVETAEPSAVPGGTLTIVGDGCEPGQVVVVSVDGEPVARDRARDDGSFAVDTVLPELTIGRHDIEAACGGATATTVVDVVLTAADRGAQGQVGIVLVFFTTLAATTLHRRPAATRS